ncbi:MAG: Na+/H+ antiporter subunit E [Spirochaetota bacterium]|nr:Na+/H+ antiporter subunit E [Spirochaetota bacterium]
MAFLMTFIILLIFWVLVSGLFDPWHLPLGIISCALVAYISNDFFFKDKKVKGESFGVIARLIGYLPWLLYQIIIANLQIAYLALHPGMSKLLDPRIVKFKSKLKKDGARVLFANSITLTPGTITILIDDDNNYFVHAINKSMAEGLPGDMEKRAGRVFSED